MIRKLKTLGLALVAVCAMSAMAASAASAVTTPGELTSDGNVTVSGAGTAETFTFEAGQKITCNATQAVGPQNVTPHGLVNPGAGLTTLTVQPHYSSCTATVGGQSLPATFTTNGCDFVLHIGETIGVTGKYGGTTDIVCGANESFEAHVYLNATYATSICTYNIPAQTGIPGGEIQNVAGGTVKIAGTAASIKAVRTGIVCGGPKETMAAVYHPTTLLSGKNKAEEPTAISITH